jgi:hypothetical protein
VLSKAPILNLLRASTKAVCGEMISPRLQGRPFVRPVQGMRFFGSACACIMLCCPPRRGARTLSYPSWSWPGRLVVIAGCTLVCLLHLVCIVGNSFCSLSVCFIGARLLLLSL